MYLTTDLAHSKLNMVYLPELLVVMTDGPEFVLEMCLLHGHKRLDDDAYLASLPRSRKATVLCADAPRCRSVET